MFRSKVLKVLVCSLFCSTLVAQPTQKHKNKDASGFDAYLAYAMQHIELVAGTAAVASAIGIAVGACAMRMMATPGAAKGDARAVRVDPLVGAAALMGAGGIGIDPKDVLPFESTFVTELVEMRSELDKRTRENEELVRQIARVEGQRPVLLEPPPLVSDTQVNVAELRATIDELKEENRRLKERLDALLAVVPGPREEQPTEGELSELEKTYKSQRAALHQPIARRGLILLKKADEPEQAPEWTKSRGSLRQIGDERGEVEREPIKPMSPREFQKQVDRLNRVGQDEYRNVPRPPLVPAPLWEHQTIVLTEVELDEVGTIDELIKKVLKLQSLTDAIAAREELAAFLKACSPEDIRNAAGGAFFWVLLNENFHLLDSTRFAEAMKAFFVETAPLDPNVIYTDQQLEAYAAPMRQRFQILTRVFSSTLDQHEKQGEEGLAELLNKALLVAQARQIAYTRMPAPIAQILRKREHMFSLSIISVLDALKRRLPGEAELIERLKIEFNEDLSEKSK